MLILKQLIKLVAKVFCLFPLQNKVVFDNMRGKGFGDDPKYIALALLKKNENLKMIWLVRDYSNNNLPDEIKTVKINSLVALYHLATARVWVDNQRGTFNLAPKRKGQYYIQTWHATFGVKKLGTDNDKSSPDARLVAQYDASRTDLMYSNSEFRANKFRTTFWYSGTVEKRDVPRIAFLMNPPSGLKENVCSILKCNSNVKFIMYAPTFRDNGSVDAYMLDFHRIVEAVEKMTGDQYVMIVRLHPNISSKYSKLINYNDKVINGSPYPDMAELLSVVDILLNDFSSSMFDFALLNKPVFLIAKDYDDYLKSNRDIYFSIKELPFSFANNEDELIRNISSFNKVDYEGRVSSFFDRIGMKDHGNGDKELAELIISKMR